MWNFKLFIFFNILYQVFYALWIEKWGLNQDKYTCVVKNTPDRPIYYVNKEGFEKTMEDLSAIDVGAKFEEVFTYSLVTYLILDLTIAYAIYEYYKSVKRDNYRPNFKCVLCLFFFFVIFGVIEIIMVIALRFSREGSVCAGDYIQEGEYTAETQDYYMTYEGWFVIIVAT